VHHVPRVHARSWRNIFDGLQNRVRLNFDGDGDFLSGTEAVKSFEKLQNCIINCEEIAINERSIIITMNRNIFTMKFEGKQHEKAKIYKIM